LLLCVPLALSAARPARGDALPWIAPGDVPLPSTARSVLIVRKNEPLYASPSTRAARRGAAARGAHLPLYGAASGPGCPDRWLLVGPLAWVCENNVRLSSDAALPPRSGPERLPDGLPYRYYFVGPDGSLGYARLATAEQGVPDVELEPGFAVAVRRIENRDPGDPFGLTTHGLWVPMRDLAPARVPAFHGAELSSGALDVAWVVTDDAVGRETPGGRRIANDHYVHFQRLHVLETVEHARHRWFRVGPKRWLSDRDVRAPTRASPPDELKPDERWIDVDTENQVLTAYAGATPVFATLVSTGKGRGKSPLATPKGVHRIWIKLSSSDMDNLEDEDADRYYAIQAVPWVMFFEKGYGLHGTFWHHSFGHVRSHGCVNLSPLDAERLFWWTGPRLPAGWTAALPTDFDAGTLVRVR
jgi:L,D-transpeptidase catalytic domain